MDILTAEDREQFTSANPEWQLDGETITRTYQFGTFAAAIGFVTGVAMAAEVADHHPDIDEEAVTAAAMASERIQTYLEQGEVRRVIARPPGLVNIVIG